MCALWIQRSNYLSFFLYRKTNSFFVRKKKSRSTDKKYKHQQTKNSDFITDAKDGKKYKEVREINGGEYDVNLLWNIDGVALSNSSGEVLYPTQFAILEIEPELRPFYINVYVTWCYLQKPDMNIYLKIFVDKIKKIDEQEGIA